MRIVKSFSLFSRYSSLLSIVVASSLTLLSVAPAHAVIYAEAGDAADLPGNAQVVKPQAGQPVTMGLTAITGTLTLTNGISEGDMFQIYIADPSNFSATTTGFSPNVNDFDSQLFLFTVGGIGILANDDDATSGGPASTIRAGAFTGPAGYYDLLITGSGQFPVSNAGLIFPNFSDGFTDPTGTYGPTGAGGSSAMTGYTGNSNEGGNYSIALTGATFGPAAVAAVPEPSTIVMLISGLALLFVARRRRPVLPFLNASVSSL